MLANQIKKALTGIILGLLALLSVACGSGSGGISEAKSAIGSGTTGGQTTGGSSGGVTVTNIYSQPKELSVGDILYVDYNGSQSSLDFGGIADGSEFILTVANTSYSDKSNFSVQISGDISDVEFDLSKAADEMNEPQDEQAINDITEQFHDALRGREHALENEDHPIYSMSAAKAVIADVSPALSEGDARSFKVLASLTSSTSSVEVRAVAECVGSNVAFYVDERVSASMLADSEVRTLCNSFDSTAAKEQNLLGSLSDVNGDGKVIVLLTPQVNALGALGGGIVTGFFSASDLYPSSSSNSASNFMEILYIMVPDPSGVYGTPVSKEFALSNLLPAVMPHELQHAISFNQHVFVSKGTAEEPWLNEGMSHLAEDLFGQNQENPSRYAIFLKNPSAYSLVSSRSPGLAARGAAYLFLRFLYEQADNASQFASKMVQTAQSGVRNVEASFGGRTNDFDQFGEFFLRWTAVLAMSDAGISQDRRFTYQPRVKDSSTGNWSGACLRCSAEDGRGTVLSGPAIKSYATFQSATTGPSAARFYKLSGVNGKLSFSGSGAEGYGVLIRTK
ncbi:MAG: hypothetical protein A3F82_10095 [Deltaproteobacteria bacterium RIFCSPLOWO2_12_FULL_44_12]|nr:MAG: hypothetical protein A2712_00235 [Deltaproteobacteria bacterium RIFCSPHIGHO2_01_FULL_43_49]OGQ15845.1 MAG: hypothetical protein A3D22_02885 [Deltaproteobacteria bacterium RIFCSPHIGHO2_02_FULL_44_53]OGQ28799.1 MAG: hypothetical protein A3D98_01215 [Deltaproteobacteria bacterium RIFCSPHIGHO2_12_FULL_44_21]OGQ32119.1 MAG: hypothetical protein A2979_03340 [Deltaproteobacteria bacterium RIFCSPLOWO2_01_FULL_45_74]OGQ43738.1 MAG: hypothetical protein A3I70_05650 [Deltaproteobacteria bacterium 